MPFETVNSLKPVSTIIPLTMTNWAVAIMFSIYIMFMNSRKSSDAL